MWPVIVRELRVAARDAWNKWYRVVAAGSILMIGLVTRLFSSDHDGRGLFGTLHLILFCIIWIFVPLATADCISKERREGTLGLLFLTPLKAWDIVIAKSLVQASRAAYMWLAAVPLLTLSFLMGGVTKLDVAVSVLIHFSSLCCALAAGIVISGVCTQWARAMGGAIVLSFLILVGFGLVQFWILQMTGAGPLLVAGTPDLQRRCELGLVFSAYGQIWSMLLGTGRAAVFASWAKWMMIPAFGSMFLLAAAVFFTGIRLVKTINKEERNSAAVRLGRKVLLPKLHRAWSRRKLNLNPVGWLEQRTWTARTMQWGWLAVMAFIVGVVAIDGTLHDIREGHQPVGWGLLAALGLTAAGSFRRERENGMLSLMLVTPLSPRQIVMGRVKGLWSQIRWATILFVGGWTYLGTLVHGQAHNYLWMFFFVVSYLTLPVTGLFCSLWRKTYFAAVAWTFVLGFVYPIGLSFVWAVMLSLLIGLDDWQLIALVMAALVQIAIAWIRGWELVRKLENRSFAI